MFGKGNLHTIKSVFWFSQKLLSETFLILRIQRDIIIHVQWTSRKVPVILSDSEIFHFFCNTTAQLRPKPPNYWGSYITGNKTHTHSHKHKNTQTAGRNPLKNWSGHCRGRYLDNAQQTREKNNHAPSGVRNHDTSNREAADHPLTATGISLPFHYSQSYKLYTKHKRLRYCR